MTQLSDWNAWWPGGVALLTLALHFAWLHRRTRTEALAWFAVGLFVAALVFLVKNPLLQDFGGTSVIGLAMAGSAALCMVAGMCLYTTPETSPWRKTARLAAGWVLAVVALHALGVAAPLTGHLSLALLMALLAFIAFGAATREPGVGLGVVGLSCLVQPFAVALAWWWSLPEIQLRLLTWVPFCVAGTTLLVVAQMRARHGLEQELVRREAAEAALSAANRTLETRVQERTAALQELVQGLEVFNRMVSHDLRGPLAGIQGLAELARTQAAAQQQDKLAQYCALIGEQARQSLALVSSLLELARSRNAALDLQPLDPAAAARQAIEQLRLARPETATVRWEVQEPLPAVRADAVLLAQVFVNLLGNAAKFSARAPAPEVQVSGRAQGAEVVLAVRDNGVGFDSAGARLFEPFQRLHAGRFEGSGIGLTIVRAIVERHGGRVSCNSRPGEGATFSFTLPAA